MPNLLDFCLTPDVSMLDLTLSFPTGLVSDLSAWLIFPENQLLVSSVFSIVYLPSSSLISVLIFIVLFLLLNSSFICSLFVVRVRGKTTDENVTLPYTENTALFAACTGFVHVTATCTTAERITPPCQGTKSALRSNGTGLNSTPRGLHLKSRLPPDPLKCVLQETLC